MVDAKFSDTNMDETMARRFIDPLTDPEQEVLTSAYHHGEKRAPRQRAHATLLSDQGHTIKKSVRYCKLTAMPYRNGLKRFFADWRESDASLGE